MKCVLTLMALLASGAGAAANVLSLVDFERIELGALETGDVAIARMDGVNGLAVESGTREKWPYVSYSPEAGNWDLRGYGEVRAEVENRGTGELVLGLRLDNPGGNGRSNCVQHVETFAPGERRTFRLPLGTMGCRISPPVELIGMQRKPGVSIPDPSNVVRLIVYVEEPHEPQSFTIADIRAEGGLQEFSPETFFPFIDAYGQYRHREWPGKTHSDVDLATAREAEAADLAEHPGPAQWNAYGGWSGGPRLQATGHFRVEQVDGRWWFVDPDGCLFWSLGMDCVGMNNSGPVSDREHYFAELDDTNSVLQQFRGTFSWAPVGYYLGRGAYATVNHTDANLLRKDGTNWQAIAADRAHRRLRSWGFNTLGAWSAGGIYRQQRTPYVGTVGTYGAELKGSTGYWHKFPDPFSAAFTNNLRAAIRGSGGVGDPWCLGFFVDNELSWGDGMDLAYATVASPADQDAKRAFGEALQARYGTVSNLNAAWGTAHGSWNHWLAETGTQNLAGAAADLQAFDARIAEQYFATIKRVLREEAPDQLYLGCRFSSTNDAALRAAARHCDVVSFNWYRYDVASLRLPDGLDRPIIIGEFNFGAADRGLFHGGLAPASSQAHAVQCLESYLQGAFRHPQLVGAHWFLYKDEPTAGRGDGENFLGGFVDVCDTPQLMFIGATRGLAERMYEMRAGK